MMALVSQQLPRHAYRRYVTSIPLARNDVAVVASASGSIHYGNRSRQSGSGQNANDGGLVSKSGANHHKDGSALKADSFTVMTFNVLARDFTLYNYVYHGNNKGTMTWGDKLPETEEQTNERYGLGGGLIVEEAKDIVLLQEASEQFCQDDRIRRDYHVHLCLKDEGIGIGLLVRRGTNVEELGEVACLGVTEDVGGLAAILTVRVGKMRVFAISTHWSEITKFLDGRLKEGGKNIKMQKKPSRYARLIYDHLMDQHYDEGTEAVVLGGDFNIGDQRYLEMLTHGESGGEPYAKDLFEKIKLQVAAPLSAPCSEPYSECEFTVLDGHQRHRSAYGQEAKWMNGTGEDWDADKVKRQFDYMYITTETLNRLSAKVIGVPQNPWGGDHFKVVAASDHVPVVMEVELDST